MPGRPLSRPPASSAALWKASTAARAVTANATCRADSCGRPSAIQRADVSSAPNPPPPSDSSITLYPSGASACLKNFRLRDPSLTFKEMWSYMVASPFAHPARPALYCPAEGAILGKIAVAVEEALARRALEGAAGGTTSRSLAAGQGWSVSDVLCTSGPGDRPFEERHARVSIALVTSGTFQYRSAAGRDLMTPGSLMLGNAGWSYQCGHEHGAGDRCLVFLYDADFFETLAADAGRRRPVRPDRGAPAQFTLPRLPPLRELSDLVARG